jgi:hypothetical protein
MDSDSTPVNPDPATMDRNPLSGVEPLSEGMKMASKRSKDGIE